MLYLVPKGDKQNPHQDVATITSMQCDVNIKIALWQKLASILSDTLYNSFTAVR